MVLFMVQEGMRCCEVARLEVGDINLRDDVVLVRGKGRRERVLPLSPQTKQAVRDYLAGWPASAGPLIRSYNHPRRGITAAYVSLLVTGWLRAAGIDASAHALRHTAATDMLLCGAHVRDVQAALGHAQLSTTERYLPWLVNDLREAMGGRWYGGPPEAA
jgi:site-specific recombinase XerD